MYRYTEKESVWKMNSMLSKYIDRTDILYPNEQLKQTLPVYAYGNAARKYYSIKRILNISLSVLIFVAIEVALFGFISISRTILPELGARIDYRLPSETLNPLLFYRIIAPVLYVLAVAALAFFGVCLISEYLGLRKLRYGTVEGVYYINRAHRMYRILFIAIAALVAITSLLVCVFLYVSFKYCLIGLAIAALMLLPAYYHSCARETMTEFGMRIESSVPTYKSSRARRSAEGMSFAFAIYFVFSFIVDFAALIILLIISADMTEFLSTIVNGTGAVNLNTNYMTSITGAAISVVSIVLIFEIIFNTLNAIRFFLASRLYGSNEKEQ